MAGKESQPFCEHIEKQKFFPLSQKRVCFAMKEEAVIEGQEDDLKFAVNYPLVENEQLIEL